MLFIRGSQVVLVVKNPPTSARDIKYMGSVPGSGRSPGGGHGKLHQYSYLENPMDRGACQAVVHRVAQSWTPLSDFTCTSFIRKLKWPGSEVVK